MGQNLSCRIISHRGLCKTNSEGPRVGENTIEAFEAGVKALKDLEDPKAIEFDVRLTKDGIPVVIHDSTVDRTTNGRGLVRDYNFSDIQKLDAGYGRKIPSLTEVFEFFKNSKGITFHIELKEKNITSTVEKIIYEYNVQDSVIMSTFDEDDFDEPSEYPKYCSGWKDLREIRGKFPIALLASDKKIKKIGLANYIKTAKEMGANAIHPEDIAVSRELVQLAHDAGLKINVWTVNHREVYKRFSEYGVDSVFCDNPMFLASVARWNIFHKILGVIFIVVGLVSYITPVPGSTLLIILGFVWLFGKGRTLRLLKKILSKKMFKLLKLENIIKRI